MVACRSGPATPPDRPSFGDLSIGAQFFTVGRAAKLALPAATGGDEPPTYTLTPEFPGMTFDPDARKWSGKPAAEVSARTMTYAATDADGDTAADL